MTDPRTFPTLHVASTIAGISICTGMQYGDLQKIASHLFGAPLWLHELGHTWMMLAVSAEGYRQFPNMPTRDDAKMDWQSAARTALEAYGETVAVARGASDRKSDPFQTLLAIMRRRQH